MYLFTWGNANVYVYIYMYMYIYIYMCEFVHVYITERSHNNVCFCAIKIKPPDNLSQNNVTFNKTFVKKHWERRLQSIRRNDEFPFTYICCLSTNYYYVIITNVTVLLLVNLLLSLAVANDRLIEFRIVLKCAYFGANSVNQSSSRTVNRSTILRWSFSRGNARRTGRRWSRLPCKSRENQSRRLQSIRRNDESPLTYICCLSTNYVIITNVTATTG